MHKQSLLFLALLTCAMWAGCNRPPQVGAENRRIIDSLKTAVFAKNEGWLADNVKLIESRHSDGKLSETEYAAFHAIVEQAQAGNWADAQDRAMSLSKAQGPLPVGRSSAAPPAVAPAAAK